MENTQTMDNSIVLLVGVGGQGTILACRSVAAASRPW